MSRRDHRQICQQGPCLNNARNNQSINTFDQLTVRKNREALQVLKGAEILFPVTLRFLLRGESIRYLRGLFNGYSEGDVPVNGYRIRYILADDATGKCPEGTLTLQGHLNSCLILLETWDYDYFKLDQFWNDYYGGVSNLCVKTRHLIHERTVGMLIGVRGQQVDHLSLQHDCDIQVLGLTLPKSTERIACVVGRIPDTARVIRDMFLTLLAKPNELNNHVVYYHPCNYIFEASRRAGGIFECPANERQRLIGSRGPQHRRRSKTGQHTSNSRSTQMHSNFRCSPRMMIDPPPASLVSHSQEQMRRNAISWAGLATFPQITSFLPSFPQAFQPWSPPSFRFQQFQAFPESCKPTFQRDIRPFHGFNAPLFIQNPIMKAGPVRPTVPFMRPSANLFSPNSTLCQVQPSFRKRPGSRAIGISLSSTDNRPQAESSNSNTKTQILATEAVYELHSVADTKWRTFPVIEHTVNQHNAILDHLDIGNRPSVRFTCSLESDTARSQEALRCIGDVKEWFLGPEKLLDAAAVEHTLDWASRGPEPYNSADFWLKLVDELHPCHQTFTEGLIGEKSELATDTGLADFIDSASDRVSSSGTADSADVSSIEDSHPVGASVKILQRRKTSSRSTTKHAHRGTRSAYWSDMPDQIQRPSGTLHRLHLHEVAQRALASNEASSVSRRSTTAYLGCSNDFFRILAPANGDGKLTVVELLVDHFTAGGIIGQGGAAINQVRRLCQCVIFIQPQRWQGEHRRIILSGPLKSVEAALIIIAKDLQGRAGHPETLNRAVYVEFIEHTSNYPSQGPEEAVGEPERDSESPLKLSDDSGIQSEESARSDEDTGDWVEVSHKKNSVKKSAGLRGAVTSKIVNNQQLNGGRDSNLFFRSTSVDFLASSGSREKHYWVGRVTPVGAVAQQIVG